MTTKHPLAEYASRPGKSMRIIAKSAGCSRQTLYRIMRGENATIDLLKRVSAATDGEVPITAFLPEPERAA